MGERIIICLSLFFGLIFNQCNMENNSSEKNVYYWEPTASSPINNPVERIDVSYFFEDESSLSVFGTSIMHSGMGESFCGADYGKDWKIALPTFVGAKWISFTERKAYIFFEKLPIEQLKLLFDNGYDSFDKNGNLNKGSYKTIDLCLLPGGKAVLYVKAANRKILLDWSAQGEESQDYELFRQDGNYSETLEDYINSTIQLNPDFDMPQIIPLDLLYKYFERFNYKIKVGFEDSASVIKWTMSEFSNAELSIVYSCDEENTIKQPSRIKYFRMAWICQGYQYEAFFYFNEEEVFRAFDEAYRVGPNNKGVLEVLVSKYNNLFDISLTVDDKRYLFKRTEIRVFRNPLSDLDGDSELFYMNYRDNHSNIFRCE